MDNDVYGHVNNVVYYALFDTVINRYLIDGGRPRHRGRRGHRPLRRVALPLPARRSPFPTTLDAGLAVAHLGRSSVRYEIGIFARGSDERAGQGWFVHVFVDRTTRRPTPLPAPIRAALERLAVTSRTGP